MSKSQSMMNNLKCVTGDRYGAKSALKYITAIKSATGESEQTVLISMVLYALHNNPEYKKVKDTLMTDAEPVDKAKLCLTRLRSINGQSEQSLLAAMVHFTFLHNPDYEPLRQQLTPPNITV